MDTVFLKDFSIQATHGVAERERRVEQEFVFDVEAECDTSSAAKSDKLKDAVDYMDFVAAIQEVVSGKPRYLIERIAQEVADRILADTRISRVRVWIRKSSVLPNGIVGISIERMRV